MSLASDLLHSKIRVAPDCLNMVMRSNEGDGRGAHGHLVHELSRGQVIFTLSNSFMKGELQMATRIVWREA
jgi:hypothetical protein